MVERVLVAVGDSRDGWCNAVIVAWDAPLLGADIESLTDSDILETESRPDGVSDPVPCERGLWLWEGVPVRDAPEGTNTPEEYGHLMRGGTWRRPTIEDLRALRVVGDV